ncbi:MAG TPA: FAD-linked oxidase C-terminal domain-containing protein [Candidatus Sulfotelmatobacter sp.]|nr:FAD-linked oxidase C-terminal domain-containing protein [Candidatus Sulfotelmatobacter sp.]
MPEKLVDSISPVSLNSSDAIELAGALRARLRGEVRFDNGSRALYATDGSNYRQVPIGVVFPHDADDVLAAIATCREFGAPLLCRGGGTSLAGQCCNVAVVLDFTRHMGKILEIDPERRIARVQPGVVLDHLRNAAEKHHLTFAPDPASHDRCTIGGMIGNNSCGVHSIMGGKTDDNIEALEVVTYDGTRLSVGADTIICRSNGASVSSGNGRDGSGGSQDRERQIRNALREIADQYGDLIRKKFPNIPRRVSGYNLNYLLPENGFHVARALVGSEGTCATTLEATCRLIESPPLRVLLVLAYPDIYQCADHIPEILEYKPIGLEGFDDLMVYYERTKGLNPEGVALLPEGGGWLLVEFGADSIPGAEMQAQRLIDALRRQPNAPNVKLYSGVQAKRVWEVRESSLGATSHVPGEPLNWEGWEDAAVAPEKLGGYLRDLRKMMADFGYKGSLYGHFGHACVHTRLNFDLQSKQGVAKYRRFVEEAADLVVSYGGSLSGEHGDGQSRAELLPKMFGPELMEAFRKFKSAWDPDWKMNPGKLIDPNRLDQNLRLGPDYAPWEPKTHFQFPEDHGSLSHAALRCVGVGKCRREEGGIMCPSWRATHEEEHSTRGRAHLLWEMTQGEVIRDGWQSEEVKHSLDLCLSCKGCKSDCPVTVDLATYKAEFLSHYYEGRFRPLNAYAFGNIDLWASLASNAPGLVNLTTQLPFLSDITKLLGGIPVQRKIPAFAPESFKHWFQRTSPRSVGNVRQPRERRPSGSYRIDRERDGIAAGHGSGGPWKNGASEVLLWADTFNNFFVPSTAKAAVEVLETAGFSVRVPRANLCCGRPLYDFGMLDRAERLLLRILDELEPAIEARTPIIGLEPSCVAVFRDELINLFPHDERAQALSKQTFLLSEFLEQRIGENAKLPQFPRKALLHGHCHHKSIMKMSAEESLLRRLGIDFTSPAPGCCGMAGSFGFEHDKYDVSQAIGELELLPAVRQAPADWLIIADGFSCREQIAQGTGRHALHLAEVLQMALQPSVLDKDDPYPESRMVRERETDVWESMKRAGIGLTAVGAGTLLVWAATRKR